jgi:hypothetical protein
MPAKIDRMIANDNIAQFERQIKAEADESLRKILVTLLAKEKERLNAIRDDREEL